jgi:hypothetical protein
MGLAGGRPQGAQEALWNATGKGSNGATSRSYNFVFRYDAAGQNRDQDIASPCESQKASLQ